MNFPSNRLSSSDGDPPCESVKVLHSRRTELKQRLQERHVQRRGEMRREKLVAMRNSGGRPSDGEDDASCGISPDRLPHPPMNAAEVDMVPFAGNEWCDFGNQFRVDVSEPAVMEYLLQLEQEIRQEQLVAMYEQAHNQNDNNDLEEYFKHLTS